VNRVFDALATSIPATVGRRWPWQSGPSSITVDFRSTASPNWAGARLEPNCAPTLLLDFWNRVRVSLPALWLSGPECRVYRPESFLEEWP
jgi:hypothetical protein